MVHRSATFVDILRGEIEPVIMEPMRAHRFTIVAGTPVLPSRVRLRLLRWRLKLPTATFARLVCLPVRPAQDIQASEPAVTIHKGVDADGVPNILRHALALGSVTADHDLS